jgi:cytochrome c oxidase cbb3-type subunit 3
MTSSTNDEVATEVVDNGPAPHEPKLMDHSYDGIQEYDNPLPSWWSRIFIATIMFAVFYGLYFQVIHWGRTTDEIYRADLAAYDANKAVRQAAEARDVSEDMLAANMQKPAIVQHGHDIFVKRCAPCHTENGRGLIGPNLTDSFQIHGTTRMDIFKTVQGGVAGTAMLAWGEQMSQIDVVAAATFAMTLRGTNVAGGKEPQGQRVERFK